MLIKTFSEESFRANEDMPSVQENVQISKTVKGKPM